MTRLSDLQTKSTRRQKGASLIEVLITMFVVAVGLLGAAGLQLASTRFQQTSSMRSQALIEADFIIEKMRVNNSILTQANLAAANGSPQSGYLAENNYTSAAALPSDPACGLSLAAPCSATQAAQRDLREWRQSLAANLPGGRGAIFPVDGVSATQANARRVVVMWQEKAQMEEDSAVTLGTNLKDASCPAPTVDGVRCLNIWVTP